MQPPFLGQGMCQGVRDVANLAWKLTAVLSGNAGVGVTGAAAQRLLDSYGQERKAHVRELTTRIKGVGAVICERDVDKARARDAQLLADCGGVVKDTPRQDVLPPLSTGLVFPSPGAGTLFPQPRLQRAGGEPLLMDHLHGHGWRLVSDGSLALAAPAGVTAINLAEQPEADSVVALWMHRHGAHVALVRPDHYVFGGAADSAAAAALLTAWQATRQ
jgi:3-(3-hydroxy-phenyl)propionate hydroxylase